MTPEQLQQKIFYGYAKAAQHLGALFNLYRSTTPINPIVDGNLVGQVQMSPSVTWDYMKAQSYGKAEWNACLDAQASSSPLNCRVGDYLVPTTDTTGEYSAVSVAIQSGGTGHAVGDEIILGGGNPLAYIIVQVLTVNGFGAITSLVVLNAGSYLQPLPSNPVSQYYTTGNGVSASFNVTWSNSGVIDDNSTYFIQALQFDMPPRVVKCNQTLNVIRPSQTTGAGYIGYAGYTPQTSETIMTAMPASVLKMGRGEYAPTKLPTDTRQPAWQILMPNLGNVEIRVDDIIIDSFQEDYVVTGNELTELGWRIEAIQVLNMR